MEKQEPIKIVIEDEAPVHTAAQPQENRLKTAARQAGKKTAAACYQAIRWLWRTEARKAVTRTVGKGVQKGTTAVANKSGQVLRDQVAKTAAQQARQRFDQVQTGLRETDWKTTAKQGTGRSLSWLSQKLAALADRFAGAEQNRQQ